MLLNEKSIWDVVPEFYEKLSVSQLGTAYFHLWGGEYQRLQLFVVLTIDAIFFELL